MIATFRTGWQSLGYATIATPHSLLSRYGSACEVRRLGLRAYQVSQPVRCWCGENGKRRDFARLWAKALAGSNPATSTAACPDALNGLVLNLRAKSLQPVSLHRESRGVRSLGFRFRSPGLARAPPLRTAPRGFEPRLPLPRRRHHDVAKLDRPMIPLQHDRPRLLLIAVERPSSGSRNVRPANHLCAVEHHGHHPAD